MTELKTTAKQVLVSFVTKNKTTATAYGLDLGYTQKLLTFDNNAIAEILDVSPRKYQEIKTELEKGLDRDSKGDRVVTKIECIK